MYQSTRLSRIPTNTLPSAAAFCRRSPVPLWCFIQKSKVKSETWLIGEVYTLPVPKHLFLLNRLVMLSTSWISYSLMALLNSRSFGMRRLCVDPQAPIVYSVLKWCNEVLLMSTSCCLQVVFTKLLTVHTTCFVQDSHKKGTTLQKDMFACLTRSQSQNVIFQFWAVELLSNELQKTTVHCLLFTTFHLEWL